VALSEAKRLRTEARKDWERVKIKVMDTVLWHKFTQHPQLKSQLMSTGNCKFVEDSTTDLFWGIGENGKGRNELGKALERLRHKFMNEGL